MLKKTVISISLLITMSSALSAEWRVVDASETYEAAVDAQGLVRMPNGTLKTWVRYSYDGDQYTRELIPWTYKAALTLTYFNCKERTMALAQEVLYEDTLATKSIRTRVFPREKLEYDDVVPDSVGESVLKFACLTSLKKK